MSRGNGKRDGSTYLWWRALIYSDEIVQLVKPGSEIERAEATTRRRRRRRSSGETQCRRLRGRERKQRDATLRKRARLCINQHLTTGSLLFLGFSIRSLNSVSNAHPSWLSLHTDCRSNIF